MKATSWSAERVIDTVRRRLGLAALRLPTSLLSVAVLGVALGGCLLETDEEVGIDESDLQNKKTFDNPVVPDCADPGVIKVPGEKPSFFMACTGGRMRIRRSDDLVHWHDTVVRDTPEGKTGFILPDGRAKKSSSGARNWAPEIHKVGDRYVAYFTANNDKGRLSIFTATAPEPQGPYTEHGPLVEHELGAIDATYFEDTDGRKYLYYKLDGNAHGRKTPILGRELADNGISFKPGSSPVEVLDNDPGTWEGGVVEAPWIVKHNGEYFLFYSGNVYDERYRTGVAKASSPLKRFKKKGAPILCNNGTWVGPGHGSVVSFEGKDYYLHHAWRAGQMGKGRFALVTRIKWENGWPELGRNGTPIAGDQPVPGT